MKSQNSTMLRSKKEFDHDFPVAREKAQDITFFKPTFDIEELKRSKELDYFRKSRHTFFIFVFTILGIHSFITILLLAVIPFSLIGVVDVNLNIIIPSYFINIAVQVFALMKAIVTYFDKEDFIKRK